MFSLYNDTKSWESRERLAQHWFCQITSWWKQNADWMCLKNRVRTWIRRIGVEVSNILLLHSINKHHVRIWYCMSVHLFFLPSNSQVFFLHLLRYSLRLIFTKRKHNSCNHKRTVWGGGVICGTWYPQARWQELLNPLVRYPVNKRCVSGHVGAGVNIYTTWECIKRRIFPANIHVAGY